MNSGPLQVALWLGLGLVAVWIHFRLPSFRPRTIKRAMLHVCVSCSVFFVLPAPVHGLMGALGGGEGAVLAVLAVVMPGLCYVLLGWVWLLARILEEAGAGTPRGGHPVRGRAG